MTPTKPRTSSPGLLFGACAATFLACVSSLVGCTTAVRPGPDDPAERAAFLDLLIDEIELSSGALDSWRLEGGMRRGWLEEVRRRHAASAIDAPSDTEFWRAVQLLLDELRDAHARVELTERDSLRWYGHDAVPVVDARGLFPGTPTSRSFVDVVWIGDDAWLTLTPCRHATARRDGPRVPSDAAGNDSALAPVRLIDIEDRRIHTPTALRWALRLGIGTTTVTVEDITGVAYRLHASAHLHSDENAWSRSEFSVRPTIHPMQPFRKGSTVASSATEVAATALGDRVLYVRLERFRGDGVVDALRRIVDSDDHRERTVVLDLRGNPGGQADLMLDVLWTLLPSSIDLMQAAVVERDRSAPSTAKTTYVDFRRPRETRGRYPISSTVVIVDAMTMSAAEIVAETLRRTTGATVVGTTTGGATKQVKRYVGSPWRREVRWSAPIQFFVPTDEDWDTIQNVGVIPDIEVPIDVELIRTHGLHHALAVQSREAIATALRVAGVDPPDPDQWLHPLEAWTKFARANRTATDQPEGPAARSVE